MDYDYKTTLLDAFINYNNKCIEEHYTNEGIIEFFPSINENNIVINNIIIEKNHNKILFNFFLNLLNNFNITKIILLNFKYNDFLVNFRYNNFSFCKHYDCYILSINNFLCYCKCCSS